MLLYLCYSKAGLPHLTCMWLCKTLTQMKYHMCTTTGISEEYTESTPERKIYGVGQGATDASTGWLIVSVMISRTYDEFATGCKIGDPTRTHFIKWTHIMFVDDTYLIHTTQNPSTRHRPIAAVGHWWKPV